MSNYLLDAARAVAGHGFADDAIGDLAEDTVAYDYVTVSRDDLIGLGEFTIADQWPTADVAEHEVIVQLFDSGYCTILHHGADLSDQWARLTDDGEDY